MEDGIFVVSAENGNAESVVRINTFTGQQEQLLRRGVTEVNDVTVFGVPADSTAAPASQVGGQLHHGAAGRPTARHGSRDPGQYDADPLGQPLKAELVGSSQLEHSFVSLLGNGEFFYFPNSDFVGTEIFTYRVVAEGVRRRPSP